MIAQAVTNLDNKMAHCQPQVLDWHTPFFQRILDRQINNLSYLVICREHYVFLNRRPDHAIQRFDCVCDVDGLADDLSPVNSPYLN